MTDFDVCPAVAVAIALEELDNLKVLDRLPTPEALLERLQGRTADLDLVAGIALAYLRTLGGGHG